MPRIRLLRIVTRLNVGGHARAIHELWRGLDPSRYDHRILTGELGVDEADFLAGAGSDMPVVRIPGLRRDVLPRADASAFRSIRREMQRFEPHILHTHLSKAGALGRLAHLSCASDARVVHTFHGLVLDGILSAPATATATFVERGLARRTDRLIAEGSAVRARLLELRIGSPDQIEVMEPGVRLPTLPDREAARQSLGLPLDAVAVTLAGRLVPEKAPLRFVELARRSASGFPKARFLIVGGGPLQREVAAAAEGLENVEMLGWRSDIETILAASDVVVITSDSEGMPLTLIEAGMAGIPAVTTDVGSASEVVVHGHTGVVCEPSVDSLENALRPLLGDQRLRERFGRNARISCESRFSAQRLVSDLDRIYASVLAGSPGAGAES